jgi:hypothetical protein
VDEHIVAQLSTIFSDLHIDCYLPLLNRASASMERMQTVEVKEDGGWNKNEQFPKAGLGPVSVKA